jgi:hypothetical protein
MNEHVVSCCGAATEHTVAVPGGTIYYRTQGSGRPLVLIGGGPSNADTLGVLAGHLAVGRTVISYTVAATPAAGSIGVRSGELQPDQRSRRHASDRPRVHEPPLGQLVPADDQASFDVELDRDDPGAALDQIAESIGVTRGRSLTATSDRPAVRRGDIQLFIHRDVPAIADYHLDLDLITSLTTRIVVTASEDGRDFYPHRCAHALAAAIGTSLIELPGNHAAMITRPAQFAARLTPLSP